MEENRSRAEGRDLVLETRGITKRFGGLVALEGVDFQVRRGDLRAIIGPNGAGKTTFFNVVTGLLPPDGGDVFFRGERVTDLPPHAIARLGVARTLQVTSIFPGLSVEENLWVGANAAGDGRSIRERVGRVADLLELGGLRKTPASDLSHGDQRLLEIGLALSTEPELLLMDEPTAGLSAAETRKLIPLIGRLGETLTVVIIEHDIKFLMKVARTLSVFHQGRKIAEGDPDSIRANEEVQEVYLRGTA
ncbi:MAG: ABC transporter ATP-binding protein [Nitrospinota bacterium]